MAHDEGPGSATARPGGRVGGQTGGSEDERARWARVKAVFLEALDRPESGRREFVRECCAGDASLRDEVASLPADHPLRAMRRLVEPLLAELSPRFQRLYSAIGRPSISPEQRLRTPRHRAQQKVAWNFTCTGAVHNLVGLRTLLTLVAA